MADIPVYRVRADGMQPIKKKEGELRDTGFTMALVPENPRVPELELTIGTYYDNTRVGGFPYGDSFIAGDTPIISVKSSNIFGERFVPKAFVIQQGARELDSFLDEMFDEGIFDKVCFSSGIMNKRPEITITRGIEQDIGISIDKTHEQKAEIGPIHSECNNMYTVERLKRAVTIFDQRDLKKEAMPDELIYSVAKIDAREEDHFEGCSLRAFRVKLVPEHKETGDKSNKSIILTIGQAEDGSLNNHSTHISAERRIDDIRGCVPKNLLIRKGNAELDTFFEEIIGKKGADNKGQEICFESDDKRKVTFYNRDDGHGVYIDRIPEFGVWVESSCPRDENNKNHLPELKRLLEATDTVVAKVKANKKATEAEGTATRKL